jgi:hypothetical protein
MKVFGLFLAVALINTPISFTDAQEVEHAPTAAQCQADQAVWFSTIEDSGRNQTVPYRTLNQWGLEMGQCEEVDKPNILRYQNVETEVLAVAEQREHAFLKRHDLLRQFYQEDEAGVR